MWNPATVQIWRNPQQVPADLGRTVVVVGNFDGVHLGHQQVIAEARECAQDLGVERLVAVTFDPHPMAVLRPEHAPVSLTTIEARAEMLAGFGVDDVFVVHFDNDVAGWSPEQFVREVLVETLHARAVVVGANFRFGAKAAGDVAKLRELGAIYDFEVLGVALEGGPQVWSSTYIRTCLAAGDVEGAALALGHPYFVRGVVELGDQRGRLLGFPTANVPTRGLAAPADGVYAGWLTRLDTGQRYPAAISVGTNPTFDGVRNRRVEAYCLDRDDLELYGVEVEIAFVSRIRGMVKFEGVPALIETMKGDVQHTREELGLP